MKIGIIGAGNIGSALAALWAPYGHTLTFGMRDPRGESAEELRARFPGVATEMVKDAASDADVVVVSVPWDAAQEVVKGAGPLTGKTVIDCTNPVTSDLSGLSLGTTSSAAELIASWAPGAHVVKAFNTMGAALFGKGRFEGALPDGFYCGDNADAKARARTLIEEAGFQPRDVGPLMIARYLEPLAMLWIDLAVNQKRNATFAFRLVEQDGRKAT
jgi:predicted dinucleotide-binding enzyme